jgi:hypothetical protein
MIFVILVILQPSQYSEEAACCMIENMESAGTGKIDFSVKPLTVM